MWTRESRALLNGIRHPRPEDPPAVDLRRSSWAELRTWANLLPPFEASADLHERFTQVAASLSREEPPSAPLDPQAEIFRFRLLTDAWAAKRGKVKRNAKPAAMRLDEIALLRRSLVTFWASTDIELALSLLHTQQEFIGFVPESGPTRYEVEPPRRTSLVGAILMRDTGQDDCIWAGLRRALFALPEEDFARAKAIMENRVKQMEDDPSCEADRMWEFRVGYAYAASRSPAAAHEIAETMLDAPRLREQCKRPDRLLAAMTDVALAQRFFDLSGSYMFDPTFGVSVWLDAAEGLGNVLIPMLDTVIARYANRYSKEQMWCVHVAQQALAP